MESADVLDVTTSALVTILKVASPVMAVALIVGLAVSLFQALAQIQEMTLAFVPKILAIFLSLMLFAPFMLATLTAFAQSLIDRIVTIG